MAAFRRNYTSCHRFKMLTRWLTFTAFLAGSANPEKAATGQGTLTVAPTCRVKGHPEEELTLNCGDGQNAGMVQYWHTPFGDLQTPGFHSKLDAVFMHHDGSLVLPNTSILHSGLYYCCLQHTEGNTLWPYELHVGHNNQKNHERSKYEKHSSWDAFRFRRDVGSVEEKQAGDSDGQFVGAVVASVLLTFVVGFSAGALTRTHVLRCLGAVITRLRSLRQKQCQTDRPDHGSEVTMATLPPMYDNQAFEMEQVWDDDSASCATMETTISPTSSFPPDKPQRSFRNKREEEKETTAYLEGCDYMKEEERRMEKVVAAGRSLEKKNKGCDGEVEEEEEREFSGFYLLGGEDGGHQTETDEDERSEEREEKDGRENREEKKEWRQEEEVEEAGEQENRSKEDKEDRRGSEGEAVGNKKKGSDERREEVEGWREEKEGGDGEKRRREEDGETDICRDSKSSTDTKQEDTAKNGITEGGGEPSSSMTCPGRRSRVIRLYQYDEDGQRYCHLPDPAPDEPGPTPRLKQRSVSLTRLNAIMAAASAGPLDTRETGREETEERPHFHMEI
ncbi:uncharacterized protein LOC122879085 isoform X2 [Siniperca chuatsi]|uniref:uncharacterized protein LOC122879085 isoform X2 n=1 Tax=Siniperca chuatsi TaxID=119488 RepID=UPI001CE0E7D7|nr:uncharacterized protein LOC122879085 isoform X2 [Siniperca chuatsi]